MKRYIFIGLCALCMGLMAGKGNAQEDNQDPMEIRGPRTGFTFLRFPTNARLEALGEAGVGLIGSGQAILYNPAGLAFMEGRAVHFTYVDWISGDQALRGWHFCTCAAYRDIGTVCRESGYRSWLVREYH